MGIKQLKKLTKEYREAVLAGRSDVADVAARLKVEAGNTFPQIAAEVANEKAAQDAQAPADGKGLGDEPVIAPVSTLRKVVPASPLVPPPEKNPVRPHVGQAKDPNANAKSQAARRRHKVEIRRRPSDSAQIPDLPQRTGGDCCSAALRALTVHRNDITTLRPAHDWIACLDESYFGQEDDFCGEGPGLIAGVVFAKDNPLPQVEQLHCATDWDERRIRLADQALETILNHENCGVLALPACAQELSEGWADLLSAWVDVLVRLLPYPKDDDPVSVTLMVEPRSGFEHANQFAALEFVCMKSLKESFPERARRTHLSFGPMPKRPDGEKSWNSYPDIVGHTCLRHAGCPTARQRYAATGWDGTCFLNLHPVRVRKILRCMYREEPLDAETWGLLVGSASAGLVRGLAERFGERAKGKASEWLSYLGYLDAHLKSGAISMASLRREVDWMERFRTDAPVPGNCRLVWLTAKLALANHEGRLARDVNDALRREFTTLCAELFDEDAGLVCDAVLNLAVAYTNAYEFEMALAVIQSLLARDRATVGTSAYGKILSSAGQHFAFLGMPDEALDSFDRALACFETLSDGKERAINVGITRAYRTTVILEHRPAEARRALALYLLGREDATEDDLVAESVRLAEKPVDKFKHHILLRYVVDADREDPIRKAYRASRDAWCEPVAGHPWELIEFYRALLFIPGAERTAHFERAWRLAVAEGGETVMVIAAVIAGAALVDDRDSKWPRRLAEALEAVRNVSGLDDGGRRQALVDQPKAKLPPLELAAKVLPFNFR